VLWAKAILSNSRSMVAGSITLDLIWFDPPLTG
jgi:hypothetical protein